MSVVSTVNCWFKLVTPDDPLVSYRFWSDHNLKSTLRVNFPHIWLFLFALQLGKILFLWVESVNLNSLWIVFFASVIKWRQLKINATFQLCDNFFKLLWTRRAFLFRLPVLQYFVPLTTHFLGLPGQWSLQSLP